MSLIRHRRSATIVRPARPEGGQKGYVLVMFALLLVPILLLSGFAIDVGSWYNRAAQIRKAADAAALAGVVWLPNEGAARTAALEAAARNGFTPGNGVTINVTPSTLSDKRLKVEITDDRVGSFFFRNLGGHDITLTRSSFAEYHLPVPLGSPRNYFGTGTMVSGANREYLYQSVNAYCTSKVQGDRHQSSTFVQNGSGGCSGVTNNEYRAAGYELYIDALEGRPAAIEVMLFDPRYKVESGSPDLSLNSNTNSENFTFELWSENSPFTVADDARVCGPATYSNTTAFTHSYLGSSRWNQLCSIPTSWSAGRYILKVRNRGNTGTADGSNQWGMVARYSNLAGNLGNGLCDGRSYAMCPRVYGKEAISVFANTTAGTAEFFLAEIDPIHAGKKLVLELWDPGEGGSLLKILQPNGSAANLVWRSYVNESTTIDRQGTGASIDVTGDIFNGRRVEIEIDLAGYAPPANNRWWKIYYEFNNPARPNVTDRTTWTARIIGDPVHLVEEY